MSPERSVTYLSGRTLKSAGWKEGTKCVSTQSFSYHAPAYPRMSREKEELDSDLDAANRVQTPRLRSSTVDSDFVKLETAYEPARQVAGDYYFFSPLTEDASFLFAVGDVSGKECKLRWL